MMPGLRYQNGAYDWALPNLVLPLTPRLILRGLGDVDGVRDWDACWKSGEHG